jgi:hypothetical protein
MRIIVDMMIAPFLYSESPARLMAGS